MSKPLAYLPALDGLRAIAVTAVVLYHLGVDWALGGFLGVDLFFVISGFLITTLLLREHAATGRIELASFWVRRFKRLVPPLVVMVGVSIAATRAWGMPEQWSAVRGDAAAALAYVANWRFVVAEQSYFETLLGPSPLRHTWSLAVEEQWYLAWPLVMIGVVALIGRRRAGATIAVGLVATAAVASAVWMAVLYVPDDPSRVYYGTDTRAQQLLVGAGLAIALHRWPRLASIGERRVGAVAVLVALVSFLVLAGVVDDDSPWLYRGGFLSISVLCGVLVVATATDRLAKQLSWLGSAPMTWIGLRSYGIYLWHWPVIVFVGRPMGVDLPWAPLVILQIAVTLALAEMSHRIIERPVRSSRRRPRTVVVGWSSIGLVAIGCSLVVLQPPATSFSTATVFLPAALGGPEGPAESTRPAGPVDRDPAVDPHQLPSVEIVPAQLQLTGEPTESGTAPRDVLLLGDSTAAALWDRMGPQWSEDWRVQLVARLGCGIVDGATIDSDSERPNPHPRECADWRSIWTSSLEAVDADVNIVMVGTWEVLDHRVDGVDHRFPDEEWYRLVGSTIDEAIGIVARAGAPVVVLSLPCMEPSGDEDTTARTDPARVAAVNEMFASSAARHPDVVVADLGAVLCPNSRPVGTIDGERIRFDGVHVSATGSDLVWSWLFPQLDRLVD